MMSLLDEAEEKGCEGVWAFKGNMRMVRLSLIHWPDEELGLMDVVSA